MTDKEALEYILNTADEFIEAFGEIPVDSVEHMAKYASKHIVGMITAVSNPQLGVTAYATTIAGLILKLKVDMYARALLAAEEAADDT